MIINSSFWQYLTPKNLLSKLAGQCAHCRITWIKNRLIDLFIKHYQIDLADALESNPHNYPDLESFFIRQFKPTARPIAQKPSAIISPVDGVISQFGGIKQNSLIQAKGKKFSVQDLLGIEKNEVCEFTNGNFATIYLAPHNYHRVYMPIDGTLKRMVYVPGKLFSVNKNTVNNIPDLFARNERVILTFDTQIGTVAVIMVGAMIVSGINTPWQGKITQNNAKLATSIWHYANKINVKRGDEIGYFTFGSTVIMLFQKDQITWNKRMVTTGKSIKIGTMIATCCKG